MKIVIYSEKYKIQWDNFIKTAKNSHFFFQRDYMEYHSDRFNDYSLLIFKDDILIALLPANIKNDTLYSHQGLTFGGFVVNARMTTQIMLEIFEYLLLFLKDKNIARVIYKCIPYIYHEYPSEEDRYALFIYKANLIRRDVTSTIYLNESIKYSKGRKWTINKAKKHNLQIVQSNDYTSFWKKLTDVLEKKHDASPVHSLNEIEYLAKLFPNHIKLFLVKDNAEILSGALLYENSKVVHTQYLANTELGRQIGALDLLLDYLIKEVYPKKMFFDFGISNENEGKLLNTGLISQKEGFGAKAIVHDFYELEIK